MFVDIVIKNWNKDMKIDMKTKCDFKYNCHIETGSWKLAQHQETRINVKNIEVNLSPHS